MKVTRPTQFLLLPLQRFFALESSSAILLLAASVMAVVVANSEFATAYRNTLHMQLGPLSAELWVNDVLMAIFFFLIGLELNREFTSGELSDRKRALLPGIGAIGGMAVPAAIYWAFNHGSAGHAGWGIPTATDIAFALGVSSALISISKRLFPQSLLNTLKALAVADDLGAVVVIAIFYTTHLNWVALGVAGVITLAMWRMKKTGISNPAPYIVLGIPLWIAVHDSGLHATIAGVVTGLMIPAGDNGHSPATRLEHGLAPWVSFIIVPIFAFANAGVTMTGAECASALTHPIALGAFFGLLLGKPLGIFTACALAIRLDIAEKPRGATWLQIWGFGMLGGIGFTMSLFVNSLSFPAHPDLAGMAKVGIFAGSIAAALLGSLWLWAVAPKGGDANPT